MALWRYTEDGQPVAGFPVTHNGAAGGDGSDSGQALTLDPDGGVWVAGHSHNGSNNDMALWRYTEAGQPVAGFPVTHHGAAGWDGSDVGSALALDPHGGVWVAGYSQNGSNYDMALWKLVPPDACPE